MLESAPPCFYFGAGCGRRAVTDKAGKSLCRACADRLPGYVEYPLQQPSAPPTSAEKEVKRQSERDYRQSEEYKAQARAYRQTEEYRQRARDRRRRDLADPAWRARHNESIRRSRAKAKTARGEVASS